MVPLRLALPLEGRGGVERRGGGGGGGEVVRAAVAGEESRFDVGDHRDGPAGGGGGGGGGGERRLPPHGAKGRRRWRDLVWWRSVRGGTCLLGMVAGNWAPSPKEPYGGVRPSLICLIENIITKGYLLYFNK